MKWIGQHIYDLVSRFRNDVYLEDISTGTIASGGHLGLDSNNKIVKATDGGGDLTEIVAGTGLSGTSLTGPIPTLNVDAAQTGITSLGTLSSLAVTSSSTLGSQAVIIDHNDIDQHALKIDATTVSTGDAIHISGTDLTTGRGIFMDTADAEKEIEIDKDYGRTTSHDGTIIKISSDKSSVTGDGNAYSQVGITSSISDANRNHANATNTVKNLYLTSNMGYADGTTSMYGIHNVITGDADDVAGFYSNVNNEYVDIKLVSSADTGDYCSIATGANGSTVIRTNDDDNSGDDAVAHFEIAADGDITLDASGQIKLEPLAGNNILLDGTVAVDGGSVTGITTLGLDSVNLTAVQTASESFADNDTSIMTSAAINDRINRPTGKIHMTHHSFTADIDTTKHYVGLVDADSESTGTTAIDMPLVFPVASKLLQVTLRSNKNLSGLTYTWRLETQATGVGFATGPTIVGTQSGAGPAQVGHTTYDFTTSLDSGDNVVDAFDAVYLSLQSDAATANTKYYITCVWELDVSSY